jgi:hypothetical protein
MFRAFLGRRDLLRTLTSLDRSTTRGLHCFLRPMISGAEVMHEIAYKLGTFFGTNSGNRISGAEVMHEIAYKLGTFFGTNSGNRISGAEVMHEPCSRW